MVSAHLGSKSWSLSAVGFLCLSVALISTFTDLRWRRILNAITYPAALAALLFAAIHSWVPTGMQTALGSPGFPSALGGFLLAFGLVFAIFLVAGFGAGDVKLAAVLGLGIGWPRIIELLLWSYAAACGLAIAGAVVWFGIRRTFSSVSKGFAGAVVPSVQKNLSEADRQIIGMRVPMGPFFLIGTLVEWVRDLL
jgi:Flp pilus assembly protein protease CpaA